MKNTFLFFILFILFYSSIKAQDKLLRYRTDSTGFFRDGKLVNTPPNMEIDILFKPKIKNCSAKELTVIYTTPKGEIQTREHYKLRDCKVEKLLPFFEKQGATSVSSYYEVTYDEKRTFYIYLAKKELHAIIIRRNFFRDGYVNSYVLYFDEYDKMGTTYSSDLYYLSSIVHNMKKLKQEKEERLITDEEYKNKKKELLDSL
ncbi:hypothetical protein [Aureispira anguillae]|nr:hypothetical protein [Aureispira anguillae]